MTLDEIETAVSSLSPADLSRFREWFFDFDAAVWDSAIESDAATGRLHRFAKESIVEHQAQRTRPLPNQRASS
jgi:hypothetical protein